MEHFRALQAAELLRGKLWLRQGSVCLCVRMCVPSLLVLGAH